MAKIVDGKLVNTEEDNKFVEEYLKRCKKIMIRDEETGESWILPLVEMSSKLDGIVESEGR